jgi:hypothetical protein
MRRIGRFLWITAALLLLATAAGAALPHYAFELLTPHVARRSQAALDEDLARLIETALDKTRPDTVDAALDFSLSATDKFLHFGLSHPTSRAFTTTPREANCIEYAELFAKIFERTVKGAHLDARVYVVHSGKARLFGQKVPLHGWEDHDWVLIEDHSAGPKEEARKLYVDPTLHDMQLGWDIATNVKGTVTLPR